MIFARKPDTGFYDLLDAQARAAHDAATTFLALISDFGHVEAYLKNLEEIEHQADTLTHMFLNKVDSQFATPLDREDLHALAERLDAITDSTEAAAMRIGAFHLPAPRPDLMSLASLLVAITQETQTLVGLIRHGFKKSELSGVLAGIHALEKRSDALFWKAMTCLMDDTSLDARLLIKWKEVYERIEKAVNRCEKVASLIEGMMVKYA